MDSYVCTRFIYYVHVVFFVCLNTHTKVSSEGDAVYLLGLIKWLFARRNFDDIFSSSPRATATLWSNLFGSF